MWSIGVLLICFPLLILCQTVPTQLHLSFTNVSISSGDNAIAVTWVTKTATKSSTVKFGTTSGVYTGEVNGTTHTYTQGKWVGIIHDVVLNALTPNTRYYYIAGDASGGWSNQYTFVTKPPTSGTVNVLVVGDIDTTSNTKAVLAATIKQNYTFALIAGDLSYADGTQSAWDTYFTLIEPQAANTMWMTAIGNHEAGSSDYNGIPYLNRMNLPNNELWYGVNYGPIHVLSFSTEHSSSPGSEQYKYIEEDLKAAYANRANVPFIITFAHKPIYTSNLHHSSDTTVRANVEPLLVRYGVDIGVWGHNHCYERTYPVIATKVNNTLTGSASQPYNSVQAPLHVTVGTGGRALYTTWGTKPAWSYYREAAYGFSTISASKTQLHWRFYKVNGAIADEFFINKL